MRSDKAMDTLLVAVDGSKHSTKVVDYAVQLAKTFSARILLVNVTPESRVPEAYAGYAREESLDPASYYEQISERILEGLGSRVRKAGVECEQVMGVGNPVQFILDAARRENASLVVLGVFGLHRLSRLRGLGSTSRRIVENSTVPVVLVP
jgi:nucleotide-binding universal stress UspA family protein